MCVGDMRYSNIWSRSGEDQLILHGINLKLFLWEAGKNINLSGGLKKIFEFGGDVH